MGLVTMAKRRLILVGGFLGAGKTTLLGQAAQLLAREGLRVGVITNDQAPGLVDTGVFKRAGWPVGEMAGGCFCCKFDDLVGAVNDLVATAAPDVILGEPVGSCTDLSATVLQPWKAALAQQFELSPFTVLIDPARVREALDPEFPSPLHPSARYILRKQLEEADIIALNKADQGPAGEFQAVLAALLKQFTSAPIMAMSALQGTGVPEWLERVRGSGKAGARIADVDYDTYAEGEAVLGWLNASRRVAAKATVDWEAWARRLLEALRSGFAHQRAEIVHLKLLLTSNDRQSLRASLTSSAGVAMVQGEIRGARQIELTINARVQMAAGELRSAVERSLRDCCGDEMQAQVTALTSLSPGRPQPIHRYARVVA